MKRLILNLVLFPLLLAPVLILAVGVAGTFAPKTFAKNIKNKRGDIGHMHTRLKELNTQGPVDILVTGSSHAYRGFDPRIFAAEGITIFDLGSSSQSPIQTELLVKKYFGRLKPRLVIIEVFPGVFINDGVESSVDLISNGPVDLNSMIMAFRINNLITYNAFFFRIFKNLFSGDRFEEPVCKNGECYVTGGFVQRTELVRCKPQKKGKPQSWNLRKDQIRAFKRTLKFLAKQDCRVMLVQAPITHAFFDAYTNNTEVDRFFRSFGVSYYNTNYSGIGKSYDLFYDRDHLNTDGVRQFNRLILALIRGNPRLTAEN
jgi:hypothetical protein